MKKQFSDAAQDAVDAFNRGDFEKASAAHDYMDDILRDHYNNRISAPSWKDLNKIVDELDQLHIRQAE